MKYAVNPSASIQQQSHPGNVATPATMLRSPPFKQSPPLRCFSLIFAAASQLKYSLQRAPYFAPPTLVFALSHPVEAARSLGPDFCHYRCHEGQCTRSLLQFRGSISPKSLPCLSSWPPPSPMLCLLPSRPVGVAVASPGAMVCFIIANKAQSFLLHQQNVQLGERVDFLHVAACAMKY